VDSELPQRLVGLERQQRQEVSVPHQEEQQQQALVRIRVVLEPRPGLVHQLLVADLELPEDLEHPLVQLVQAVVLVQVEVDLVQEVGLVQVDLLEEVVLVPLVDLEHQQAGVSWEANHPLLVPRRKVGRSRARVSSNHSQRR
jgi:hypothetical protein